MKQLLILISLLTIFPLLSQAQKAIDSGQVTMEITDVKAEDAAIGQQMEMMKGTKTIMTFNADYSMVSLNMMEGLISMKTMTVSATGDSKMYMDAMGMKYVVPMEKAEKDKMISGKVSDEFNIEYDKSDTKEIAGYQCYKAVATHSGGNQIITAYITEEIDADPNLLQGFEYLSLTGFPLEYTADDASGTSITFTATDFTTEIDEAVFNVDESGYQKMSLEEFSKMGGMGF